ncbi:MAG: TetR/AcrR family transcriptional regulator [Proteobacteria bacterium]|nr:TetR/AcrR family transcriptional regulator [Pseudomonadota bacterium]
MPKQAPMARAALLEAAARLFAGVGFAGVNSNQIAREAGVGVGTFYRHFADKRAVLQALVVAAIEALERDTQRALTQVPSDDVGSQLRGRVEALVSFAERDPDRFRAAFGEPGAGRVPAPSARALERRLRGLQRQGRVDSALHPGAAAKATLSMQFALVSWWLEDRTRVPRPALVETLVRLHPAHRSG